MPSNSMDATNASGLPPNDTKSLKERNTEPHEEKILQGIKEVRHMGNGCARHTEMRTNSCTAASHPR